MKVKSPEVTTMRRFVGGAYFATSFALVVACARERLLQAFGVYGRAMGR